MTLGHYVTEEVATAARVAAVDAHLSLLNHSEANSGENSPTRGPTGSLLHLQSAYDGASELEQEWWAVEISAGEHILFARLRQALAFFEPARLREAITADPVAFAEIVAVDHGLVRIGVVGPDRVVFGILIDHGLEPQGPAFVQDVLSFQYYGGRERKLWSIRASRDGKILTKKLLRSFGK